MSTLSLISTAQVAAQLGVSVRHVARLVAAEKLTPAATAPGPRGAFLFDPADVAALADERAA